MHERRTPVGRPLLVTGIVALAAAVPVTAQARPDTTAAGRGAREAALDAAADSAFVREVERARTPYKVLHAEPLFIDLIRDLGARRGEAEWNVGVGLTEQSGYDAYKVLVEYEWAPRDRLGFEIELPATIYSGIRFANGARAPAAPASRLDGLKTAVQWTAHVSERHQASFALGYLNELRLADPFRAGRAVTGNLYNPFAAAAKRWTHNVHTLVLAGVRHEQAFGEGFAPPLVELNTSAHYMLPGTRNFVGVEANTERQQRATRTVLRPQMRLAVTDHLLLGVAVGVPVTNGRERLGTFFRVIYEPAQRATAPHPPGRTAGQ